MAQPSPPAKVKEFEATLRTLLAAPLDDAALRGELESLAASPLFPGFTYVWGPVLYARNRVVFRPLVEARFATWLTDGNRYFRDVAWTEAAAALDGWLVEVDRHDDVELFRKLYTWKHGKRWWGGLDAKRWRTELLERFRAAKTHHARNTVLAKFDMTGLLDEPTALALDDVDAAAARAFILKDVQRPGFWGETRRSLWASLFERARSRGDDDLAFTLYRKQVPLRTWRTDVLQLCDDLASPAHLLPELERRHPEGWGLDLGDTLLEALKRRGVEVHPYVKRHLRDVWGGWTLFGSFEPMVKLAEREGWLDLWCGLIRVASRGDRFDAEVARLVGDRSLEDAEVCRRLGMLAGVSREWNFPGLGLAQVKPLKDTTACALYARFPELMRGPYKMHVGGPTWGETYGGLAAHALEAGDELVVDYIASRLLTRVDWGYDWSKKAARAAEWLSEHYEALRTSDPQAFARRAAAVLGQVPAFSISSYDRLIQTNRLARLLCERSSAAFLDDPAILRDLLEAPEIHVQALALRALGLDDDRARALAAANLDLLQATLLRPLHRRTRLLAFGALWNAASTPETARRVLDRARQALDLPDRRYPREALIGLIGRLLHAWPELRSEREQPVVYVHAEAGS